MADLRIADAQELLESAVEDGLKIPTGGFGNYSISMLTISDWLLNYKDFADKGYVDDSLSPVTTSISNHIDDVSNPHNVTKEQVGLGNVDNTADVDKPISDFVQEALDLKANQSTTYTKTETDAALALKVDQTEYDVFYNHEKSGQVYTYSSDFSTSIGGYPLHARIALSDGDIVRSEIANNTNDPNNTMTGWVNTNLHNNLSGRDSDAAHPASAILDDSGENQQVLNSKFSNKLDGIISLLDFGAIGDGVADDTVAVQSFVDYICENHVHGFAPKGVYKLTSKINFTGTYGWGIIGSGSEATTFKQFTDNTPIFDLGSISGSGMHSYLLSDFKLSYNTSQPSANTDANPIRFSQMGYEGELNRISFASGSWAIKVVSGIGGPWGQHWDNLNFGNQLTGGAMDWTGAVNAVPNNYWGRFLVTCSNMVGPIFRNIRGYNWVWSTLEMLDGKNVQWISMQAGSQCVINSLKMELCTYSAEPTFDGNALMYFPSGQIDIGQLNIGGTYSKFEFTGSRYLFTITTGSLTVKMLSTALTVAPTYFYLINTSGGNSEINYRNKGSYTIDYTNIGSSIASQYLTVFPDKNEKLSSDKGDADYSVSSGDPAIIIFETTLTAGRTVSLPVGNNCFNGLRYRVISRGAVNSTNTISITASSNIKATLTLDKTFVDLEWRRNPTSHLGWVVIGSGVLP